eukprot:142637_1
MSVQMGDYIDIPDGIYSFQTAHFQDVHYKGYIYISDKQHKYSPKVSAYHPTQHTISFMDNNILFRVKKVAQPLESEQQNGSWYHIINLMYLDDNEQAWYMDVTEQSDSHDTIFTKSDMSDIYSEWAFKPREDNKFEIVSKKSIHKCLTLTNFLDGSPDSYDHTVCRLTLVEEPDNNQFNNSMLWYINPIYFNIIDQYPINQLFHANFKQLEMEHTQLRQLNIQYKNKWMRLFGDFFVNKTIKIKNAISPPLANLGYYYLTIAPSPIIHGVIGDTWSVQLQLLSDTYRRSSFEQLIIVKTQWHDKFAIQSKVFPEYYLSASENGDVCAKNITIENSQLTKDEAFSIVFEMLFNDNLPNNIFDFNKQKILFKTQYGTYLKVTDNPHYNDYLTETPFEQDANFWRHPNKNEFMFVIEQMVKVRNIPFLNQILTGNVLTVKQHQILSNSINYELESKQHQILSNSINYTLESKMPPITESPSHYFENVSPYALVLVIVILIIFWQIYYCSKYRKPRAAHNIINGNENIPKFGISHSDIITRNDNGDKNALHPMPNVLSTITPNQQHHLHGNRVCDDLFLEVEGNENITHTTE